MRKSILAAGGLGLLFAVVLAVSRPGSSPVAPAEPATEPDTAPAGSAAPSPATTARRPQPVRKSPMNAVGPASASPSATAGTDIRFAFNQAIDTLLSPTASYEQKQGAWKQLKDTGKLDEAIGELERRMADDPRTAEYPAALGQAYLQKCALIHDIREQGILAMKADQVFDAALSLDPFNWDARFTKAVAMSYWPTNMNKSAEVIEHFQTLIEQQEAQPPQPQFAQTYLWLGDQYQKAGQGDYARAIWQRGAALFPDDPSLKARLAPDP
jgi:hypothetical protein